MTDNPDDPVIAKFEKRQDRMPQTTPAAERAVEALPSAAGTISALASANAPFLYFDEVTFCVTSGGIAGVTLSASRQIALLPDGTVANDRVIVAHLRASLPTMLALRGTIDSIENLAKQQGEALAAAALDDAPARRPH